MEFCKFKSECQNITLLTLVRIGWCLPLWLMVKPVCYISEIKERIKKTKDEKKAKKAEVMSKQKTSGKANVPKGAAPKGPKIGGGGGKR